jgi:hypothetical protein
MLAIAQAKAARVRGCIIPSSYMSARATPSPSPPQLARDNSASAIPSPLV